MHSKNRKRETERKKKELEEEEAESERETRGRRRRRRRRRRRNEGGTRRTRRRTQTAIWFEPQQVVQSRKQATGKRFFLDQPSVSSSLTSMYVYSRPVPRGWSSGLYGRPCNRAINDDLPLPSSPICLFVVLWVWACVCVQKNLSRSRSLDLSVCLRLSCISRSRDLSTFFCSVCPHAPKTTRCRGGRCLVLVCFVTSFRMEAHSCFSVSASLGILLAPLVCLSLVVCLFPSFFLSFFVLCLPGE